jgi:hypothetical protein
VDKTPNKEDRQARREAKLEKRVELSRELMKLSEHPSWSVLEMLYEQDSAEWAKRIGDAALQGRELDARVLRDGYVRFKTLGDLVKTPSQATKLLERALSELNLLEEDGSAE